MGEINSYIYKYIVCIWPQRLAFTLHALNFGSNLAGRYDLKYCELKWFNITLKHNYGYVCACFLIHTLILE